MSTGNDDEKFLDQLEEQAARLLGLLRDRHPGLMTWNLALGVAIGRLQGPFPATTIAPYPGPTSTPDREKNVAQEGLQELYSGHPTSDGHNAPWPQHPGAAVRGIQIPDTRPRTIGGLTIPVPQGVYNCGACGAAGLDQSDLYVLQQDLVLNSIHRHQPQPQDSACEITEMLVKGGWVRKAGEYAAGSPAERREAVARKA